MPVPSRYYTSLIFAILSASFACAESRAWKSVDGERAIDGEFLKRDANSVTIRLENQKEVVIPLDKLANDDRAWLNANHPLEVTTKPNNSSVFDQLIFGDSRNDVLTKLKASKFVTLTTDETFIGRTGLNGIFRTRQKIGGLDASLYFDWTESNQLKEITLQTDGLTLANSKAQLLHCWKDFIALLTTIHGEPIVRNELRLTTISDGTFASTHLWKLEKSGSAQLGAARDGDNYQIVVRFTEKEVKPVAHP
ncbi:MAG: hypothetical protein H8M99_07205 [Gloeobacteraceae cyanobacterium ES-bin-144]|nr:hypothetical protein [Verrucomicrobiales bacterium]